MLVVIVQSLSCLSLCDPMDCSAPGFPVLHYLLGFAQTQAHWVGDAIQPSHPLSPTSLSALAFSQHQGLFTMTQPFISGSQSIGASASASVLPVNIQGWILLGLTGLIFFQSKGLSRVFSSHSSKASILQRSAFVMIQLSHTCMTTGKTVTLTRQTFGGKVMSLFFNMLTRFVIAFLPKSKHLLISWLQLPCTVSLEPKKQMSLFFPLFPHLFAMKWWDQMPWS